MVKQNFLTKMLLLCALIVGSLSSAWAVDVTYTVNSKGTVTVTGTAPSGSSLNFTNTYTTDYRQMTSGNSQTWTYSGFSGLHITKLVLSMKSNSSKGAGSLSYSIDGGDNYTDIVSNASFNSSSWYGSWSTDFVDIVKDVDINVGEYDFVLKLTSSQNSIYCTSIKITYEEISETTEWTVSYDGNGATSGIEPTDATVYDEDNNEVTVLGNTGNLAKTGYTFSGWNTQSDGEGTTYVADNTFTISANITLYAKWTVNSYNVTLPAADDYGTYTMSATNPVAYGTEVTLTYTPASGYENYDATWNVNGSTISGNTFTMPAEAVTVTVKVEEKKDYVTLPFTWAGGPSADLKAISGVTVNADNSDYASSHAPYLVKFNGDGKFILVKTDGQPGKVTVGVKKIGGKNNSYIIVQGSSDGSTFTDIERLEISGASNAIVELETSNAFATTDRYVRLYFDKTGDNVGVGPISIAKPTNDPVINAESTINLAADATSGEIDYTISNPVDGTNLTASVEDGCDWITDVTVGSESVTFITSVNEGDERSADITLTYGEVTKTVTVTQAKLPFTITDGVFDFTQDEDYGSGLAKSSVKVQTSTWTAVNVTMVMTGRNCWFDYDPDQIRLYKANGNEAAGSITLSVPEGSVITNIAFTGASLGNMSPDDENCSYNSTNTAATWEGVANSVTFTASERTDIETIIVTYISMPSSATVNIPDSHYGTYCSEYALDFSGTVVEAYTAAYVESEGKVVLTKIADGIVPANTGVVLYSEITGEQDIPTTTTDATISSGNEMVGVTAQTAVPWTEDGKYNYILQQGKFKKATGAILRANRAYLSTTYNVSASGAPELDLVFGDETTGIQSIERTINGNQYYTLDGRRVAQPTKGLYIVNGKKVVIK